METDERIDQQKGAGADDRPSAGKDVQLPEDDQSEAGGAVRVSPMPQTSRAKVSEAEAVASSWICDTLSDHLTTSMGFEGTPDYTPAARTVLLQAWRTAADLGNRRIVVEHLIFALATGAPQLAEDIENLGKADLHAIEAGALVRLVSLHSATGRQTLDSIEPSENVMRWMREALRTAESEPLEPRHLVAAIHNPNGCPRTRATVRRILRDSARVGLVQSQLVKARRANESLGMTVGFFRTRTNENFSDLKKSVTGLDARLEQVSAAVDQKVEQRLAALDPRLTAMDLKLAALIEGPAPAQSAAPPSADFQPLAAAVVRLEAKIDERPVAVSDPRLPKLEEGVNACRNSIFNLAKKVERIGDELPKPMGTGWLTLAVLGVIGLGAAAGLLIDPAQPLTGFWTR